MLTPVILSGGSGSRLWPLSRQLSPKQFLKLTNNNLSMLQNTIARLKGLNTEPPILICNEEHRFVAAEQMRSIGYEKPSIILEPVGRNTAPAIALAALKLTANGDNPMMLVLPADHLIQDNAEFLKGITKAMPLANSGRLVTFGITPTHAETGYGYIECGENLGGDCFSVKSFAEKPNMDTAIQYLSRGGFFWNSGMFLFHAQRYLDELERFRPDILNACVSAMQVPTHDLDFTRVDKESFYSCISESIDYAVMEHTNSAAMITLSAGWSDIGSWSALWEASEKDKDGNSIYGDVLAVNTAGSLIRSESRLVTTVGIKDLLVIETKDSLLIADKNSAQDVKSLVEKLKLADRPELTCHREVYRPWGMYDSLDNGDRYQVKRIMVKPGAKLSVQMHHHRAEHWIVVSGTAKVRVDDKSFLLTENQSTFIPLGKIHSLENPGVIPLELIEVQSGSYLGEDDIVRIEDKYGRA